jgi:DNA primase small subunit
MASEDLGLSLLSKLLSDFYRKSAAYFPERIDEREFGMGDLERKIAFRHLQFKSNEEFRKYMIVNAPPYVSCSSAYYHFPAGRPMSAKGWIGSELIFDLDANDMHLDCQKAHGGSWVCDNCLENVKAETLKLIEDFLIPDFGFSDNEIKVNFSGNRGYHVHVNNEAVMKLDTDSRKEVSDYISGHGINFDSIFKEEMVRGSKIRKLVGPKPDEKGWSGKVARKFISMINNGKESLEQIGIDKSIAKRLYEKRALVEMGIRNGNWDMVYIKNKSDFWKSVIEKQAVAQSDRIDKNVTNDTGHMIRLAGSIHGGSGLVARKMAAYRNMDRFDPMKDAVAFREGNLKIIADTKNVLSMNGKEYGPYNKEEVTIETAPAMYLYLKGLAKVISAE